MNERVPLYPSLKVTFRQVEASRPAVTSPFDSALSVSRQPAWPALGKELPHSSDEASLRHLPQRMGQSAVAMNGGASQERQS